MISNEFSEKLNSFPNIKKQYLGVFSIDTIPKKVKKNQFFICNTDVSNGPGQHWFCVFKEHPKILECFDSRGVNEQKKQKLMSVLKLKGIKEIKINKTSVQSETSSSCGNFVLYFLIHRFHNQDLTFEDLLNDIFVESTTFNEESVKQFCESHFD